MKSASRKKAGNSRHLKSAAKTRRVASKVTPKSKGNGKANVKAVNSLTQKSLHPLKRIWGKWQKLTSSLLFGRIYAIAAGLVLAATTVWWSLLGAQLHQQNADQLVDPMLFDSDATFHNALLPSSHSFLIKWPLFYLIKIFGYSSGAYIGVTVGLVLLTVGLLAFVLYRIERRPVVFGTLILALSSVLLMIPATPYPGALLPVNMAMLATRNIEYIVLLAAMMFILQGKRLQSWKLWIGTVLLLLLMASDKLFMSLVIGGVVLAILLYAIGRRKQELHEAARLLLAVAVAAGASIALLWALKASHWTNLTGQGGVGPYGLVHSLHTLLLGSLYALLHILTNMGANPAAQIIILREVPHQALHNLFSLGGLAFVLNFLFLIFGLYAAYRIIHSSVIRAKHPESAASLAVQLSVILSATAVTAIGVFAVSNHYYAVDARYLAIVFFALVVCAATYARFHNFRSGRLALIGLLLIAGMALTAPAVLHNYRAGQDALAPYKERNQRIAAVLRQHPVQVVVGDYWRVIPLKSMSQNLVVDSLANCTQPRDSLTSKSWQPNLSRSSFAYILTLDGSLTDFPHCNAAEVISAFGRPNSSVIIAGSAMQPQEMVLFYDHGAHRSAPGRGSSTSSFVTPSELKDLTGKPCEQPTIMNIVAHEDDDLLFMNPDTGQALNAGDCVRTVYLTTGDAGQNAFYWLGREQGSHAAYAKMTAQNDLWVERNVHITQDVYATMATPRGNNKVSLIYLHLPDGNIGGQGFAVHHYESLAHLLNGKITTMHDLYHGTSYSAKKLETVLAAIMAAYQPAEIHTQAHFNDPRYPDHSDHEVAGVFASRAYQDYKLEQSNNNQSTVIKFYIGYPIHGMPANLTPSETTEKANIFDAYSHFDTSVCHTMEQCSHDQAYGAYLARQYEDTAE